MGDELNRLANLDTAGLGGWHIHQGPKHTVINNAGDCLALANVITKLDRIEIADLTINRRGDVFILKRGPVGRHLVPALDGLGDVVIAILG